MAFGHWMQVVEGDVSLRLGPVRRDDVHRFISRDVGFGLQSYEVGRYLGATSVPTHEGEQEWWDGAAKSDEHLHWGVYLPPPDADGEWLLVGTTTLHLGRGGGRQAESGFLLVDRQHWGRRIASTAHLGRTLYAFRELDLLAITSAAYVDNVGSNRALTGVGYVKTGVRYADAVVGGRPIDSIQYLLANPQEEAWRYFWRRADDDIPPEFHAGREKAHEALRRAEAAVTFL